MDKRPYIGITDFMTADESLAMLDVFDRGGGSAVGRALMIGVMMSYKTLHELPTKWSAAFPKNREIAGIFVNHPLSLNTIHYADYSLVTTSLEEAVPWGGENLHAFQLDMPWPDPALLGSLRASYPNLRVILQVGQVALNQVGNSPDQMLRRLESYADSINDVLLDRSMGQGKRMDSSSLAPFVLALSEQRPDLGIAVAGGLGPYTVHLAESLTKLFSGISIDAQGQLRPSGNAMDPIEWALAAEYLRQALKLFQ